MGWDGTLKVWEAATGRLLADCAGDACEVSSVAFSPDGRLLASGRGSLSAGRGAVKVWEAATGRLLADCTGHRGMVSSVAFSPDGRFIASGSNDLTVRLWEVATTVIRSTGHCVNTLFFESPLSVVAFPVVSDGVATLQVADAQGRVFRYELVQT
jgi:WD40 repeat protein